MYKRSSKAFVKIFAACFVAMLLSGCATLFRPEQEHRAASVVDYLYPNASEAPRLQPETTTLRPPVRVGIAFVPGGQWDAGASEEAKQLLLARVKAAFAQYPAICAHGVASTILIRLRACSMLRS